MKTKLYFLFLCLFCLFLFYPFLRLNFVQDDFYLLSISKVSSIADFVDLFIPKEAVVWYRPLSSEVFFFLGRTIFNLNPFGYHLIVIITHILSGILIYYLSLLIVKNKIVALLTSLIYVLNTSIAVSLGWLATYSFVLGPFLFILFSILFIRKKYKFSILIYFLGLVTSEVFVLSIPIIVIYNYFFKTERWEKLLPFFVIPLPIFIFRLLVVKTDVESDIYSLNFVSIPSSLKFYILRSIGLPDGIGNYKDSLLANIVLVCFFTFIIILLFTFINLRYQLKKLIPLLTIYCLFLIPFILLSNHKASYYLSFSLIGFSLVSGLLLERIKRFKFGRITLFIAILTYLVVQSTSVLYTYKTHWIVTRANLSKTLVNNGLFVAPVGTEEYFSLGANKAEVVYK